VAPDTAGKGELLEELAQPALVLALFRIDLGIRTLEVPGAQHAGRAVARASHENHVEIVLLDEPVQVNVHERKSGARPPVPEETVLDMFGFEGRLQ
jgi:hypothetical protein